MKARLLLLAVLHLPVLLTPVWSAPAPKSAPVEQITTPKKVKVAFANARWHEVFGWLAEQTGKRVMSCTPGGTFTLIGPPDKEYTVAELVAAINEAFASQAHQFILIEREKSFSLLTRDRVVGGR